MGKKGPNLPDIKTLMQAGIQYKTGAPKRAVDTDVKNLPANIKTLLRIIDEQDAVNRGTWYNLPSGITSQELERMLYYKGQLCFFYYKDLDQFYFMPYALDGTIDFYGRFNSVHPVPFANGKEENKAYKQLVDVLSSLKLKCIYEVQTDEEKIIKEDLINKGCVLLHDYTKQLSQTIIPRVNLQDPLLDVMADMIPFMRTSLITSTGISGIKVQDGDESDAIEEANSKVIDAARYGTPWISILGKVDFQELTGSKGANKSEEYMLALQALDNFRLSTYGIDNGGLFEKKVQELNAEAAINGGPIGLVQQDATSIRQNFCNIVNSIYGLGIWYEPSESITQADINGDGLLYDRQTNGTASQEGGNENYE